MIDVRRRGVTASRHFSDLGERLARARRRGYNRAMQAPPVARVRLWLESDIPRLVALNNMALPHVNAVDEAFMRWSLACGCWQGAACEEEDGPVAGFASVLGPGLDYASPNYRFFAHRWGERARAFVYIDRIVVAARTQRAGLGRLLYERLFTDAAAQWPDATICCEVNLRPANEASLRFHEGLGFVRVGEQSTESGAKRVALLERRGGRSGLGGAL